MRIKRHDLAANAAQGTAKGVQGGRIYIFNKKTPYSQKTEIVIPRPTPAAGSVVRIKSINTNCQYIKFARYIVGRLMRLRQKTSGIQGSMTGWYEFVHDDDRKALNQAAGWSDAKNLYLLENPKVKVGK